MKLSQDFVMFNTDDEGMLVAVGGAPFSGMVRGNGVFRDLLDLLSEEITEADLIAAMTALYNAPEERIVRDVKSALEQLREIGALVE